MAILKKGVPAPFRGKRVILYFYPKDNTPGCTAEACNLRDNYSELTCMGIYRHTYIIDKEGVIEAALEK